MDKTSITTAELLAFLKLHPYRETECRLLLGNGLGSTHYWYWDAGELSFMHTRDWPFSRIAESDILQYYGHCQWIIDQ